MPRFRSVTPMLKTLDMAQTVKFYMEKLGFTVETLWPQEKPTFGILKRDAIQISFLVDKHGHYPDPCLSGQVYIDVEDVKALHTQMEGKVEYLWGPEVYFYKRREFAIRDNNGYTLTFSEATTDPPTCPED